MKAAGVAGAAAVAGTGAVVFGVWMLFERNQRGALEAKSYVRSIHTAAEGWVANTEALMDELRQMPALSARIVDLAAQYADARGRA